MNIYSPLKGKKCFGGFLEKVDFRVKFHNLYFFNHFGPKNAFSGHNLATEVLVSGYVDSFVVLHNTSRDWGRVTTRRLTRLYSSPLYSDGRMNTTEFCPFRTLPHRSVCLTVCVCLGAPHHSFRVRGLKI